MKRPDEHYDDDTLSRFAENPDSLDTATKLDIELHVANCVECQGAVEVAREFGAALPDAETWWIADELSTASRRASLRSFAMRIAEEDREAERLLRKFVDSPLRFTSAASAILRRCRTGGAVRLLSQAAHSACAREPLHALNLADVACQIADALPDDYYPADAVNELRGTAWKAVANANRFLGRFPDGFKAADRAERAYRRVGSSSRQLGRVAYIRGALSEKQQDYEAAMKYAQEACHLCDGAGDLEGFVIARNLEAVVLQIMGRTEEALDRFASVQAAAQMMGDLRLEASALQNIGKCHLDRGDWSSALRFLLIALQHFKSFGMDAEVLRTRWTLASVSLGTGDYRGAERQLTEVNAESSKLGLDSDVALIKLDLAEAKLVLGDMAAVKRLCREIFGFFREARMLTGALTAAAYLEEVARLERITNKHIQHVRRFVHRLRKEPDAVFLPPLAT